MIPVFQTILADPERADGHNAEGIAGNCYQAALASVLELPLEQVPHFAQDGVHWCESSGEWLTARGLVRSFYDGDARLAEMARRLSGMSDSSSALEHAAELLALRGAK